jgi:arylsulfatase
MDGWKAVVEQPQNVMMTDEMLAIQKWELYHVAEDFSESTDLAEQHPQRLQAMIERWWIEAGKYDVLPLDARMAGRMAERKPTTVGRGPRTIYYPGGAPHFEYTAVNLKNRSHRITAEVDLPPTGAEGVLLAHGSLFAGYSLYVKGGRLIYVHNYLGLAEYRIESTETVPSGRHRLVLQFDRTGEHRGRGTLFFDDRPVGQGEIPQTIPALIETSGEGLCCGYDSGLPVTSDYDAPFAFSGRIERVIVDVDDPGRPDPDAQVDAAMNDQ